MILDPYRYKKKIAVIGTATTAVSASANSLVVDKPNGVVENDIMLSVAYKNGATGTITPPAGWVDIYDDLIGQISGVMSLYYKIAGGSEPSNYTFNFSDTTRVRVAIAAFSNVDTSAPINDNDFTKGLVGTHLVGPDLSTNAVNCMYVLMAIIDQNIVVSGTPPVGMTEFLDVDGNAPTYIGYELLPDIGATGIKTVTITNTTATHVTFGVALKPK